MTEIQRVALVTGGASGIGLAIAERPLANGMAVVIADRDPEAWAKTSAHLASHGDYAHVGLDDVGTEDGAGAAINTALERLGHLDVLCNNAGMRHRAALEDLTLEDWHEAFRVNVDATFLCSQKALEPMKRQGAGSIVNISSISGLMPYAGGVAYAAPKAALIMLTRTLALELGPHGVTVNCICPGSVQGTGISIRGDRPYPPQHIPVRRYGEPSDVASMVSYVVSLQAGYLNGAVLTLDSGVTAGRAQV